MKDVNDPIVLKEYIEYLAEMADSIFEHSQITDNDYQSLFIESKVFCKRVSEANKLPSGLKTKFTELRLPKMDKEFSFWSILKLKRYKYRYNDEFDRKRRENILRFKDRLKNILLLIEAKS